MLKLQELHTRRGKPQRKICFDYDDSIIGCDFQSMFNYVIQKLLSSREPDCWRS